MVKIRAILFDKDGTLLGFNVTWLDFVKEIALKAADGVAEKSLRLLEAAGYDHDSATFRPGSPVAAGTNADIIEALYPALSGTERQGLVVAADAGSARVASEKAAPLPGVIDALNDLKSSGYRLGVATNDATSGAEATLLAFGVAHLFDAAYGYDAVANPKPAPDVLLAFADTVGVRPGEVAMVGDNAHDLEAARNAGAGMAVGVLSGTGRREDLVPLADVILGSVADLPRHLEFW